MKVPREKERKRPREKERNFHFHFLVDACRNASRDDFTCREPACCSCQAWHGLDGQERLASRFLTGSAVRAEEVLQEAGRLSPLG